MHTCRVPLIINRFMFFTVSTWLFNLGGEEEEDDDDDDDDGNDGTDSICPFIKRYTKIYCI